MKKNKATPKKVRAHCHRDHREGAAALQVDGCLDFWAGLAKTSDGDFVFERDFIRPRASSETFEAANEHRLAHRLYLAEQIDKVLGGSGKCNTRGTNPNEKKNDKRFEIWYASREPSIHKRTWRRQTPSASELADGSVEAHAIIRW